MPGPRHPLHKNGLSWHEKPLFVSVRILKAVTQASRLHRGIVAPGSPPVRIFPQPYRVTRFGGSGVLVRQHLTGERLRISLLRWRRRVAFLDYAVEVFTHLAPVGPQQQGALEVGKRPVQVTLSHQGLTQYKMRTGMSWVQPHRFAQLLHRLIESALAGEHRPQIGAGIGVLRIQARGLMVVRDGRRLVSSAHQEVGKVVVAQRKIRLQVDRLIVMGACFRQAVVVCQRVGKAAMHLRIIGVACQIFHELSDSGIHVAVFREQEGQSPDSVEVLGGEAQRFFGFAKRRQGISQPLARIGVGRVQRQGGAESLHGGAVFISPKQKKREVFRGVGVLGVGIQRLFVMPDGVISVSPGGEQIREVVMGGSKTRVQRRCRGETFPDRVPRRGVSMQCPHLDRRAATKYSPC